MTINELKLSAIVKSVSEVIMISKTDDEAINIIFDFPFGQKHCTIFGTA
jgi:hypothetical protein